MLSYIVYNLDMRGGYAVGWALLFKLESRRKIPIR